jgi:hypothetical protein
MKQRLCRFTFGELRLPIFIKGCPTLLRFVRQGGDFDVRTTSLKILDSTKT